MNKFFKTLLILQTTYLTISFFIPNLPGWKMFASVNRTPFIILNMKGEPIDYRPMLPNIFYSFSKPSALQFSKFVCLKGNHQLLTLKFLEGERYEFQGPKCDFKKI